MMPTVNTSTQTESNASGSRHAPAAAGSFVRSRALQRRSHAVIRGGAHTYAKGDDQYPVLSPGFIVRGKGSHVWDLDGNEYIEYGMGCRAVTLGHAYEPVVRAAQQEMMRGSNFTRPSPIELQCAEELLDVIEGAEMVKFTKDGSAATTAALKLARAYTGRDHIALCGDQPFFAVHDWFIGTTPMDAGIPPAVKDLSLTFRYNDIDSVRALFDRHPGQIGGLIMEPARAVDPENGFLHDVQALCREHGTVFILDEMITGFRWHLGGGQRYYGVVPDLSTFGKALANGFSVSALVGRRELMELGGLRHAAPRVFLLSTTHGAETHALAAAIETIRTYRREGIVERLYRQGRRLALGFRQAVQAVGLSEYVEVLGKPCNLEFIARDERRERSQAFRTLLLQETIRRGVLMPSLVVSAAHRDEDIDATVEAVGQALRVYRRALEDGVGRHLVGRPSQVVQRKWN